jgi:hypothetical protein
MSSTTLPFKFGRRSVVALAMGLLVSLEFSTAISRSFGQERSRRNQDQQTESLLASTRIVRAMSESDLIAMVPKQSGLHYVDCPHCSRGRQENQLRWSPERPAEVECEFCNHRYPSTLYPESKSIQVRTPRGEAATYPYWEDQQGYRHFFSAKRDDLVRNYLAQQARDLASLYRMTKDEAHARRSALIVVRFAEVFPNWCFHYDYPFRQKEIYDGAVHPKDFRSGFRTARWTWWAYSDIPTALVQAYDEIRTSQAFRELASERGQALDTLIERDLVRNACDQVLANEDLLTNMSPTAWRGLITAGKVIHEPHYVHECVRRLSRFVETQFFYDGMWSEGSPDYGSQSLGGLEQVVQLLKGYSDPPGYVDPTDRSRFDNLDLGAQLTSLQLARESLARLRLPDTRAVPIHDTWSTSRRGTMSMTQPYLLPALGHACLGGGESNRQTQMHLTWSGGYGHSHGDHLSILLHSGNQELLSDLGYTHTAYRAWTLATAAHNTVVVDGRNQELGNKGMPTDGKLQFFDVSHPGIQIVKASGTRGYPGLVDHYQRSLISVEIEKDSFVFVDVFEVSGGQMHDYFLHGDADRDSSIVVEGERQPVANLLPNNMTWTATKNEGETSKISVPFYAYGFLRNIAAQNLTGGERKTLLFRGTAPSESGTSQSGPSVVVTFLPEQAGELFLGENPSIRRAKEDDAKLDTILRPFAMWRQKPSDGKSRFISLIEPMNTASQVNTIERLSVPSTEVALRFRSRDREYLVLMGASQIVDVSFGEQRLAFSGEFGVFSYALSEPADVAKKRAYVAGGKVNWDSLAIDTATTFQTQLLSVGDQTIDVSKNGFAQLPANSVVRIVTEDDWVYPLTITQAQDLGDRFRLRVREQTSFDYDATQPRFALKSFPQREHRGTIRVLWTASQMVPSP